MALFDVPGWTVPGAPVAVPSKKRKPPQGLDQIQAATVNVEKLMKRLATEQTHDRTKGDRSGLSADADAQQPPKKKRKRVKYKVQQSHTPAPARGDGEQNTPKKKRKDRQNKTGGDKVVSSPSPASPHSTSQPSDNALTTLQRGMKQSLDGARFRYVKPPLPPHPPRTQDAINCARPAFQVDQ